jgi:anti-sigma factor RsiW
MTDRWLDRISDYLDDELTPAERAQFEAHVASCAECAATLHQLEQVVGRARSLQPVAPQSDLWQGIAQRITAQAAAPIEHGEEPSPEGVVDLRQFANRKKLRLSFSVPQLAAAGITLMLVSGAAVFLALRGTRSVQMPGVPTVSGPFAQATAPAGATHPSAAPAQPQASSSQQQVAVAAPNAKGQTVAQTRTATDREKRVNAAQVRTVSTEKHYDQAVSDLQTILQNSRRQLDPKTVRALEDNLRLIDKAIADARKALANDSTNVYLNEHLADNMHRKLDLLRRATSIVSGRS